MPESLISLPFLPLAFSIDWEAIIPIILFILYGLGNVLGGRKKRDEDDEDDGADALEQPQRQGQGQPGQPAPASDRARRIQEEIRRKIAERTGQPVGGPMGEGEARTGYDPTVPEHMQRRAEAEQPASPLVGRYDPNLPENMQRRVNEPGEAPTRPTLTLPSQRRETAEQQTPSRDGTPALSPAEAIQRRLAEQRARAEETARERAAAERRAAAIARKAGVKQQAAIAAAEVRAGSIAAQVRQDLRDPVATRRAIVLNEILGTPTGLRKKVGHEAA